jgi:hypothetical protein
MSHSVWGVPNKKRSYIEVWVLLLLICSVNFFDIIPITNLVGVNGPFTFYLLSLFFMFTFNRRAWIGDSSSWLIPLWWFLFGVVLSFIPAQIYYGQSFVQSFFTYRHFFELAAFPILIALRPNEKELRTSLYAFSVLYLFICLYVTFIRPSLVPVVENREFVESGNYMHVLPGIRHVFLAFIFAFHRAIRRGVVKNYGWLFFLFLVLFIAQNRTSLIAVFVVSAYVLFTMKMSSRKLILMSILLVSALLMVVYTSDQWGLLYKETVDQITNPEYNRIKSLIYMTRRRSFLQYLLGEGFISANVNPIIHVLQEGGIDHSDVGFIGLWHQFGVIPLVTVLVMTIKGLSSRHTFLVRLSAIYTLTGALTLSYIAFGETLLWFSCYLYLYYASNSPKFQEPIVKQDSSRYLYSRSR